MTQLALFHDAGCFVCGSMDALQAHHIDFHHGNNASENRVMLCARCHATIHSSAGYMSRAELLRAREAVDHRRASGA